MNDEEFLDLCEKELGDYDMGELTVEAAARLCLLAGYPESAEAWNRDERLVIIAAREEILIMINLARKVLEEAPRPFCILCGMTHRWKGPCDLEMQRWVFIRRKEIAAGVPWESATKRPAG